MGGRRPGWNNINLKYLINYAELLNNPTFKTQHSKFIVTLSGVEGQHSKSSFLY
jgi:hypothetical protein